MRESFAQVRERLPDPELIDPGTGVRLETVYLEGRRPTLVCIHGGLGNLWNFYPQLAHFFGTRAVVSYSLAGNGRSDSREDLALESHVEDLRLLLNRLAISRPVIVGWSYGTEVAIEYAKRYETAGVCLAAGGAYGITPRWELPMLRIVVGTRVYRVLPPVGPLKAFARATMFHPKTSEAVIDDMLESNPLPRRHSAWRTVIEGFWGYDGREGIEAIEAPALVVHGPADRVVPQRVARETAKLLPHGRFEEIPESGHVLLSEQPALFNRLLEAVIRSY